MKTRIILAAACSLLFALPSTAQIIVGAPLCVSGTLASYIALGSEGCMFGSVLYHDFTFAAATANGIDPANILVTPAVLPTASYSQGLNFSPLESSAANGWSVAAGKVKQFTIGFAAVPYPPPLTILPASAELTLALGTAHVSGIIGSVNVQEVTQAATLDVYDRCADACTEKLRDTVTIMPAQILESSVTVTLSGGSNGASLSSFSTDYLVGPQPE
ncbi:MAG: hypothetical protein ABSG00_01480 [Terracidiphilus sp.]|jgi:hypothetical protein